MLANELKVTQRYLYADWFFMGSEQSVQHVSCFDPLLQQPFLILRHSRSVPLFNEFFLNNPLSRIQHVEHLRLLGFRFYVLGHSFGFILPTASGYWKGELLMAVEGRRRTITSKHDANLLHGSMR